MKESGYLTEVPEDQKRHEEVDDYDFPEDDEDLDHDDGDDEE